MPVLTGIDVVGIQRFIFGSNRLRDVVGASWLVEWAASGKGALAGIPESRILLAAGGNAIVAFEGADAEAHSRKFAGILTRRLFDDAPGVEAVITHRFFNDGELARALRALQVDLAREKLERRPHAAMLGLGVTAGCANTGLPATDFDPRSSAPLSRQAFTQSARAVREEAKKRWRDFLPERLSIAAFDFPDELDDLGATSGERSLIGVVHVDGNGVGRRITRWIQDCVEERRPDDIVRGQYIDWSRGVIQLGEAALRAVLDRVNGAITDLSAPRGPRICGTRAPALAFPLKKAKRDVDSIVGNRPWWLPIRPVLLGGDDLTFLCDGRIALDLAATALRAIQRDPVPHLGSITACAGVAIVPSHSPFVRSYELTELLCQSAKRAARRLADGDGTDASFLDWHIGLPKPGQSLSELRAREYEVQHENGPPRRLTCRPYRLGTRPGDVESWTWLDEALLDDQSLGLRGKIWSDHRNKVKALRDVVREGPESVSKSLEAWRVVHEALKFPPPIDSSHGFFDLQRTPLLDALELLDLHLPLDPGSDGAAKDSAS